jgi:hypothetical protein
MLQHKNVKLLRGRSRPIQHIVGAVGREFGDSGNVRYGRFERRESVAAVAYFRSSRAAIYGREKADSV